MAMSDNRKKGKRWKLIFIDNLVVAEHLLRTEPRPVELLNRPMDEDTFERLRLGQTNGPVVLTAMRRNRALQSLGRTSA